MFFGATLTMSIEVYGIFHGLISENTMHHCFIKYYDKFEGDVVSCLALYSSYLHHKLQAATPKAKKKIKKQKKYDGNIFGLDKVIESSCRK